MPTSSSLSSSSSSPPSSSCPTPTPLVSPPPSSPSSLSSPSSPSSLSSPSSPSSLSSSSPSPPSLTPDFVITPATPASPPELEPLVPGRFADVLQSCVLGKAPTATSRPLCHSALFGISQADVEKFRDLHPMRSAELDRVLGEALGGLTSNHRVLALWLSLLLQDVDLLQHRAASDVVEHGRGEAARRIAATLRQSARARDDRVAAKVPTWAIVTIAVLGGLLIIVLVMFGLGAAAVFG